MVRAVFFDAAGTLFEPKEPVGVSYARIAVRFGVRAEASAVTAGFHRAFGAARPLAFGPGRYPAELRQLERQWWRELVARVFAEVGQVEGQFDDFDAYFDALFAFFAEPGNWVADPEAPPMLRRLRNGGFVLGIISNFDHRLYRILEGLGLAADFDSVTISSEAGFAKPSPELFADRDAQAFDSSRRDDARGRFGAARSARRRGGRNRGGAGRSRS